MIHVRLSLSSVPPPLLGGVVFNFACFTHALWTKPWRNFFHYFEIMVSNDTMNPETLFEYGKVAQSMLKEP